MFSPPKRWLLRRGLYSFGGLDIVSLVLNVFFFRKPGEDRGGWCVRPSKPSEQITSSNRQRQVNIPSVCRREAAMTFEKELGDSRAPSFLRLLRRTDRLSIPCWSFHCPTPPIISVKIEANDTSTLDSYETLEIIVV